MTPTQVARTLVLLVGGLLSGACATSRYSESRVQALPPGGAGKTGPCASVKIEGLEIGIETQDRTRRGETTRRLALRMVFHPEQLGYSFDPGQVVLRMADGREWRGARSGYVLLSPGMSFGLQFDTAVDSRDEATLVIGGLARGTSPLEPVTVALGRHEGRSFDRLYWLEALGVLLSVPFAGI